MSAILKITDGTTTVDLLYGPFYLNDWRPAVAQYKDGGVMSDSPLIDGSRLAFKRFASTEEAFDLKLSASSQNQAALNIRRLQDLLEKATSYWTDLTDVTKIPVYIIAKASAETETRYATILNYSLPEIENQYSQPFLQPQNRAVYDNISLVLLRGDWLGDPPGTQTAVEISARSLHNLVTNPAFEAWTAGNPDDWTEVAIGTVTTTEQETGSSMGQSRLLLEATGGDGYIYQDVNVLDSLTAGHPIMDFEVSVVVELVTGTATLTVSDGGAATNPVSISVTDTTKQTISVVKTATANGIRISLLCTSDSSAYFDDVRAGNYYGNVDEDGVRDATTDTKSVFHANKHNYANITHVMYNDAGGPGYSINLYGTALPYDIAPAVIADGDSTVFGIETVNNPVEGPFSSLVMDLGDGEGGGLAAYTGGASGKWQYWGTGGGAGWKDLNTILDFTNRLQGHTGANPLQQEGLQSVHWFPPTDWVSQTLSGVDAYWVRVLYTVPAGAITTPSIKTFQPYTITVPYIEMQGDQVSGDMSMLARFVNQNRCYGFWLGGERVFAGLRTLSRGEDFTPYLNMSDAQNPPFMGVSAGLGGAFVDYPWAPTGRAYQVTATDTFTLTIKQSHVRQYSGRYRAFIRLYQTTGTPDEVTVQLRIKSEDMALFDSGDIEIPWDPAGQTTATSMDFGEVSMPGVELLEDDRLSNLQFLVTTTNASARTINFYDIVLIPVDEFSAAYISDGTYITYFEPIAGSLTHSRLDVDSISSPRKTVRPYLRHGENEIIAEPWIHRQSGPTVWSSAGAQRMWFYYYNLIGDSEDQAAADPWLSYSSVAFKAERYLTPRGDS